MITAEHIPSYQRLARFMEPEMLMLGKQANTSNYKLPVPYKTLDLDGGDLAIDLGDPTDDHMIDNAYRWRTVFNLGTLEHVWDAHQAHITAASMVMCGGHFLGLSPVAGWEGHGIHVTDYRFILSFFNLNGFQTVDHWFTTQAGNVCDAPKRNGGKSVLLWFATKRAVRQTGPWKRPSQVYANGVKPS